MRRITAARSSLITLFTYNAMRMYRNYDGRKSAFGDVSIRATAPDPDTLSAFAATRSSDGATTIMLVHKALSGSRNVTVRGISGRAEVWQLTSSGIARLGDSTDLVLTVPPQSVTLLVVAQSAGKRRAVRR